jgi:hypothetical protein
MPAWMRTIDDFTLAKAGIAGLALTALNPKNVALAAAASWPCCSPQWAQARPRRRPRLRMRARKRRASSAAEPRMPCVTRIAGAGLAALAALVLVPTAVAAYEDEKALAEKHAPIVRLVQQDEVCGYGEPFQPTDIDLLLDEPTVALRGPWNRTDLVEIGPSADDLVGRFEYHLDFPGDALDPGCDYNRWAQRLTAGSEPAVYAHVVGEQGRLAVQYWFFYPFNDFNNTHEGDWEMIQLVFDAADARAALDVDPAEVGYSSHEGAERAAWDDDKLEVVGAQPVVYPAAGSHANKYSDALWLGSSAEAGVGCDDTRGPHTEVRPRVETIPSDPRAAQEAFPWIAFEGRWGELQEAFFNGPTGPNQKRQWTEPITWAEDWRDQSYAVPAAGLFGTGSTDFFCSAVAAGSRGLVQLLRNPGATLLVLGGILALVAFVVVRATWTPVAPLRLGRRRAWGQVLSASARMYAKRPLLLLGIGLVLIPLAFVTTFVQWALVSGLDAASSVGGEAASLFSFLALVVGAALTLLGLGLVQAATACALVEVDGGRRVGPVDAYRLALRRIRPLLGAIALFVLAWVTLTTTVVGIPVAIWLGVRWALAAPVVELEDRRGYASLRRSGELVRGRWLRVGSLVGLSAVIAIFAGPLLGALLIIFTDTPLALLNVVAGVVYALAMPFVALVTAYVYFDARTRLELEPFEDVRELPAEIALESA